MWQDAFDGGRRELGGAQGPDSEVVPARDGAARRLEGPQVPDPLQLHRDLQRGDPRPAEQRQQAEARAQGEPGR